MDVPRLLNILVVEDDPALRDACCRYLRRRGCQVTPAGDGAEGLSAVRREAFDLVMTDLHMPVSDGLTFWRQAVAARPEIRGRFLFCTTALSPGALQEAGATERFLSKPFDLSDLWAEIVRLTSTEGP